MSPPRSTVDSSSIGFTLTDACLDLLIRPTSSQSPLQWFQDIAELLLNRTILVINERPYRLREIEFYYKNNQHPDSFTHGHEVQLSCRRWYLHRMGKGYKNGSFKGLDLTFGDSKSYGGILIRSLEGPEAQFVHGSSLCVDHILEKTGLDSVVQLDEQIGRGFADDASNPVKLVQRTDLKTEKIWQSSRVGLSLKKAQTQNDMARYYGAPYRFLVAPRTMKKGRLQLILHLLSQGLEIAEIATLCGSPRKHIERHRAAYHSGLQSGQFKDYFGQSLGPEDVSKLHGLWSREFSIADL